MTTSKSYRPTEKDFDRKTYLIDAQGKTLGRLATKISSLLIGKGKRVISPDQLCGDNVVVINAAEVYVTGKKAQQKMYKHYSGYPGGLRLYSFENLLSRKPEEIIMRAVSRMLPKNRLGEEMLRRLRVFKGKEHNQQAQKPISLEIK